MDANPFGFIFALWRKAFSAIREDEKASSLIVLFDALLHSFLRGVTQFVTQLSKHLLLLTFFKPRSQFYHRTKSY
jgi:hypothetical protein